MDKGLVKFIRIGQRRAIPDAEIERLQIEGMRSDLA
jgi:hypothetical protein